MKNIVFTGPAFDNSGQNVLRANLIAACQQTGRFNVQSSVGGRTDLLVASRTDTAKAKRAAAAGVFVMTYPEFINRELADVDLDRGFQPAKYSKYVDLDMLVPDFTEGLAPSDLL